jgi:hypothetical protein
MPSFGIKDMITIFTALWNRICLEFFFLDFAEIIVFFAEVF